MLIDFVEDQNTSDSMVFVNPSLYGGFIPQRRARFGDGSESRTIHLPRMFLCVVIKVVSRISSVEQDQDVCPCLARPHP